MTSLASEAMRKTKKPLTSGPTRGKTSVVYFLLVENERIKIGYTDEFPKRLKSHQSGKLGSQIRVEPLCVVRGGYSDEQAILRHFESIRFAGEKEVFHIDAALVDYIRWLRAQYYVWTPEQEMAEIDALDILDSTLWMPAPDRRAEPPVQKELFQDFGPLNLPTRDTTPDDFYTDASIIDAARRTFGGRIDLDPASHSSANRVVKATKFYTLHDDGTRKDWGGNVWLNPPFSEWQVWVPKIISEWRSGRVAQMCVLSATRTVTAQYFADIHKNCSALCIFRGRIPFWGGRATTPDDGHAVFYFGNESASFASCFADLGTVYRPFASKQATA